MEENTAAGSDESFNLTLEGRGAGRPISGIWKVLFGLSGLSVLLYGGKAFARLVLGHRHHARLVVEDGQISLAEETRFVGREMRKSSERFSRAKVMSARLESKYPYLPTMLGLISLGVGVIVGLFLILDGIQGEWTPWIMSGVGVLLLGVLLDFGFSTLANSLPGKTSVALYLPGDRVVRILNCDKDAATKLVQWLHSRG